MTFEADHEPKGSVLPPNTEDELDRRDKVKRVGTELEEIGGRKSDGWQRKILGAAADARKGRRRAVAEEETSESSDDGAMVCSGEKLGLRSPNQQRSKDLRAKIPLIYHFRPSSSSFYFFYFL